MKLVVGISGASGAPYAERVLSFLREHGSSQGIETHLVLSKMGRVVWNHEIGTDPASYGFPVWLPGDMTAPMASGSARFDAMVVVPCSGGSLSRIAHGTSSDLLGRSADVMLKERRKLVLVLRETPLSLVHIRNLEAVTLAGAVVLPAVPSFYSMPQTATELIDTVTSRILDQLGIDNELMRRWTGLHPREES
jgi:4-hydroxy-3-polyprenylbenzoate decarboxylase